MADDALNRDAIAGQGGYRVIRSTRGAVRYRDKRVVLLNVLHPERVHLRRAGFSAHSITLERNDGSCVVADLWIQDEPCLADYLNAAYLLFDDEPGSVHWDATPACAAPRSNL